MKEKIRIIAMHLAVFAALLFSHYNLSSMVPNEGNLYTKYMVNTSIFTIYCLIVAGYLVDSLSSLRFGKEEFLVIFYVYYKKQLVAETPPSAFQDELALVHPFYQNKYKEDLDNLYIQAYNAGTIRQISKEAHRNRLSNFLLSQKSSAGQ